MPRHRRLEIPGGIYHVITRGIEQREIFKDDEDREDFLRRLGEAIVKTGSKCYGWALMPNHFHLLIRTGAQSLSDVMRKVLSGYAIYFNHRHKRKGYLYHNRYKSILCQEETYLLELVRYIHLNPVRGGLVKGVEGLQKYRWSGHSVITGERAIEWQSTGEILERFGGKPGEAVQKYIEFVKDGQKAGKREDLAGGGLRRSAGGWQGVSELRRNKEYWRGDERILGDGDFVNLALKISDEEIEKRERLIRSGWTFDKLVKRVCDLLKIKVEDIRKRGRMNAVSHARSIIAYWGQKELGISGSELAKHLDISRPSVTEAIARGEKIVREYGYNLIT